MKNNQIRILLIATVLLAGILRFYKLSSVPPGLYSDEASIAYNAYAIAETGKDEYGKSYPLIFKAFGEYKLPVYIYSTALSMKLFGEPNFSVRFPSALAGTLSVLLTFFLVKELFYKNKNKNSIALFSSFFLAISPWHLHFSHAGFEANLSLFFLIGACLAFIKAIKQKTNLLSLSVLLFVLSFSTYNSARVFSPLFFLTLCFIYKEDLLKMKRQIINSAIIGLMLLLPFIPQIISGKAFVRASSEGIIQEEKPIQLFFSNYLANFDTTFLFFRGDQNGRHSVRKLGMLYVFELPLIIIGIKTLLEEKNTSKGKLVLFAWLLLAPIPSALTKVNPHALRLLLILPTWHIISAIGLVKLSQQISKQTLINQKLAKIGISLLIVYFSTVYLHRYYTQYIREAALDWSSGIKETVEIISSRKNDFDEIYISNKIPPVYLGIYFPIEPRKFIELREKGKIENIIYFEHAWEIKLEKEKKILIIAPWWQKPAEGRDYESVTMINNNKLFNIWEE